MAERWGISPDLWDLAALLPDLSEESRAKPEASEAARRIDLRDLELQEAELRATEALKKRLETQVAILNDEISRLKQNLQS